MTAKIREQILQIRSTGLCNMFSVYEVQRLAYERNFYELVLYLEESRDEYVRFILYGDAAAGISEDEVKKETAAESEENDEI